MKIPVLKVENLTIKVNLKIIVSNISFEIYEGEILGLFGDSGSGKTTILHAIFGLIPSNFNVQGGIYLNGSEINQLTPEQRSQLGMSIVLQDLGLFEDRSVYENIAYPLYRRGFDEDFIKEEVKSILALLQILDLSMRKPKEISGGQRQRVALARALVYKPKILLLDESLRGLQEGLRLQFLAFVKEISKKTVLIMVTHERSELEIVANKVITLSNGKILGYENWCSEKEFSSLVSTTLIPHTNEVSTYKEVRHLKILPQEASNKDFVIVLIKGWRKLSNGKHAAFVTFNNDEPGCMVFEKLGVDEISTLPVGNIKIGYEKVGD